MRRSRAPLDDPLKPWRRADGDIKACHHEGCSEPALYRAPQSPDDLNSYYWFCLDHVREYNRAWNFYAGMNEEEIEAQIRRDTVWQRPTWPLGSRQFHTTEKDTNGWRDAFDMFAEERARQSSKDEAKVNGGAAAESREEHALTVLDLEPNATLAEVKARYKELVKRYHPDANGGDHSAEERLKRINEAYSVLKTARQP